MLLELPDDLLRAVAEKMDGKTLRAAFATCRVMRGICEGHHAQRKRAWIAARPTYHLDEMLTKACRNDDVEVTKLVLAALRSRFSAKEGSPKWYEADHNSSKVCILLKETVDRSGSAGIVDALLFAGADPTPPRGYITTALHSAWARGLVDIVALLEAAGADKDALDVYGLKPADVAFRMCEKGEGGAVWNLPPTSLCAWNLQPCAPGAPVAS